MLLNIGSTEKCDKDELRFEMKYKYYKTQNSPHLLTDEKHVPQTT